MVYFKNFLNIFLFVFLLGNSEANTNISQERHKRRLTDYNLLVKDSAEKAKLLLHVDPDPGTPNYYKNEDFSNPTQVSGDITLAGEKSITFEIKAKKSDTYKYFYCCNEGNIPEIKITSDSSTYDNCREITSIKYEDIAENKMEEITNKLGANTLTAKLPKNGVVIDLLGGDKAFSVKVGKNEEKNEINTKFGFKRTVPLTILDRNVLFKNQLSDSDVKGSLTSCEENKKELDKKVYGTPTGSTQCKAEGTDDFEYKDNVFGEKCKEANIFSYTMTFGKKEKSGLSKGIIALIVVLAVIVVGVVVFLIIWFVVLKKKCGKSGGEETERNPTEEAAPKIEPKEEEVKHRSIKNSDRLDINKSPEEGAS